MRNIESSNLVDLAPSGAAEVQDPHRRRYMRTLAAGALALSGCGGGGSGGGQDGASESPGAGGGQPSSPAIGDAPPKSGAFGGGAGKILYVEFANTPKTVKEIDLATRQVRTLLTLQREQIFWEFVGGVSRASNETFALVDRNSSLLSDVSTIYVHREDGTLLRSFLLKDSVMNVAISSSGKYVTYTWAETRNPSSRWTSDNYLLAGVIQVDTGEQREFTLFDGSHSPSDKIGYFLSARSIWASDSLFYVMFRGGYARVDVSTGEVTRVLDDAYPSPGNIAMTARSDELWFQSPIGNPYGQTIWSTSLVDGTMKRRSMRSKKGFQHAPAFSPDGQWLLLQQGYIPYGAPTESVMSIVRYSAEPIDTEELDVQILDSGGKRVIATGRMAWY